MRSRPQDECSVPFGDEGPWETTTLIGRRWKHSNVFEPSGTNCPTASVFFKVVQRRACTCTPWAARAAITAPMPLFTQPVMKIYMAPLPEGGMRRRRYVGGHSEGAHLFPYRTEQLSPSAPMVLAIAGRVGRRQFFFLKPEDRSTVFGLFCFMNYQNSILWMSKRNYMSDLS